MSTEARTVMLERHRHWESRGATVKKVMAYLEVNEVELADRIGVKRTTLRGHLTRVPIPPWELDAIATALDVPVDILNLSPQEAVRWILDNPSSQRGCLVSPKPRRTDRRKAGRRQSDVEPDRARQFRYVA